MSKPFVCCAVIVNQQNQYLLIKRANEPFKGQWSFISGIGASKKGLKPTDAVKDEVAYDIGVDFLGHLQFTYSLPNVDYADQAYVFLGHINQGAIRLNPKAATEYRWFSQEELQSQISLAFDDKQIFNRIKERINQK